MCEIVRKQLALPADSPVSGESKFTQLGADSLDTVLSHLPVLLYLVSSVKLETLYGIVIAMFSLQIIISLYNRYIDLG